MVASVPVGKRTPAETRPEGLVPSKLLSVGPSCSQRVLVDFLPCIGSPQLVLSACVKPPPTDPNLDFGSIWVLTTAFWNFFWKSEDTRVRSFSGLWESQEANGFRGAANGFWIECAAILAS